MKYNRYSVLMMLGHICTDINQGALPAILPFLVLHKGISYASAAGLIFAANSVSSIIQPFFGYLGDKASRPWLMGLGAFLAGSGMALVGFLDSYWAIFGAVAVSGTGIALFHPEGGRMANLAAGEQKGKGMALFSVGGNIGFALGPIITSTALLTFGMKGTAVLLIPAVGMLAAVLLSLKKLNQLTSESHARKFVGKQSDKQDNWKAFTKVASCVTCRAVISYGMTTFIPLYFAAVLLLSEASASASLTLFSVSAAIGTLMGGQVADRFGFTKVIKGSFMCLAPLMLLFPLVSNSWLAVFLLIPIALALNMPMAVMIALGQKLLPNHIGTSSGIMLGLAISIGGMVTPGIGWIGDQFGLTTAMYTVAGFAVLTFALVLRIPASK